MIASANTLELPARSDQQPTPLIDADRTTCPPSSRAELFNNIPAELRAEQRWVVARRDKVPCCAFNPNRNASSTNALTWSSYSTALDAVTTDSSLYLGFMLGDGWIGVDLDKCRDLVTGVLEPWAQDIVTRLDSYSEASVSGTGVHVICKGTLPPGGRRKGSIEMYDKDRYFVMTGRGDCRAVDERTTELALLHQRVFGDGKCPLRPLPTGHDVSSVRCIPDDDLLDRIRASSQGAKFHQLWTGDTTGYPSRSEAELALCRLLAFYAPDACQIDRFVRRSGLCRKKWDRRDYRERTIAMALDGTHTFYHPAADIPELPLDPDMPAVTVELDSANMEAL